MERLENITPELGPPPRRWPWVIGGVIGGLLIAAIAFVGVKIANLATTPEDFIVKANTLSATGDLDGAVIELRNALQLDPQHAPSRWLLAQALLKLGDGAGAFKEATRAKSLGLPEDTTLVELRALLMQGEHRKVIHRLAFRGDAEPSLEMLLIEGEAALGNQSPERAIVVFEQVLTLDPKNAAALEGLAFAALANTNTGNTAEVLERAVTANPDNAKLLMARGQLALQQKSFDTAFEDLQKAHALDPELPEVSLGLVQIYLRRNDAEAAKALIEPLVQSYPNAAQAHFWRGVTEQKLGDTEAAKSAFRAALAITPNNTRAQFALATQLYLERRWADAEPIFVQVVAQAPRHVASRKALGAIQLANGKLDEGLQTLLGAVELAPTDSQLRILLGRAYEANGNEAKALEAYDAAAQHAPDTAEARTQVGLSALRVGDQAQAIESLEAALKLDPSHMRAESALVLIHLKNQQPEMALTVAKRFADANPEKAIGQVLLGRTYQALKKIIDARIAFNQALEIDPSSTDAYRSLARLGLEEHDVETALSHYETAVTLAPTDLSLVNEYAGLLVKRRDEARATEVLEVAAAGHPSDTNSRLTLSALYLRVGASDRALELTQEAYAVAPNRPTVLLALGKAQTAVRKVEAALKTYVQLTELTPQSASAWAVRGQAHGAAGELDDAYRAFEKARALDPTSETALQGLGVIAIRQRKFDLALATADVALQNHPQSSLSHALRGDAYAATDEPEKALAAYRQGFALSGSQRLLVAQAHMLVHLGRFDDVDNLLTGWQEKHPEDRSIDALLAENALRKGDKSEATTHFERLAEAQPNNPIVLNNLAWTLAETDPERALSIAGRAAELAPRHAAIIDTYGWMQLKAGLVAEAVGTLERTVQLEPDNRTHRYHLATALAENGKRDEARSLLTKTLKTLDDFEGREDAQALLDSLTPGS